MLDIKPYSDVGYWANSKAGIRKFSLLYIFSLLNFIVPFVSRSQWIDTCSRTKFERCIE